MSRLYSVIVKWCRRGSALAISFALFQWVFGGNNPVEQVRDLMMPLLSLQVVLPLDRALMAAGLIWFAFLTQLRFSWALWLPIYLILFPLAWLVWHSLRLLSAPLMQYAKAAIPIPEATVKPSEKVDAGSTKQSKFVVPTKRVWLFLFFTYLLVFRGLELSWAAWIPPLLALPIWFFFLRMAYQCAVTPITFVGSLTAMCTRLLDSQIKAVNDARQNNRSYKPVQFVFGLANSVLSRYSDERVLSVIQRESLAVFSLSLVIALISSSIFWGLVGVAAMQGSDVVRASYGFFNTGSFVEAVIWAWGCMTTTVDFPGSAAPVWLKAMHASILATGLFQLTFLLACFSIMTSSEGQRSADDARRVLKAAREKLEETRALEAVVVTVVATNESGVTAESQLP